MHATSSRKADAAMHEICGVRRIVPVRSIGHKKRQKELWKGVTLDGRALDRGRFQARIIPGRLAPVQKRPTVAPCGLRRNGRLSKPYTRGAQPSIKVVMTASACSARSKR